MTLYMGLHPPFTDVMHESRREPCCPTSRSRELPLTRTRAEELKIMQHASYDWPCCPTSFLMVAICAMLVDRHVRSARRSASVDALSLLSSLAVTGVLVRACDASRPRVPALLLRATCIVDPFAEAC